MGLSERRAGLAKGLSIGTHVNNQDFWGIAFGRPTAFLLLLAIGDLRWVTPNRLTHASNVLVVAGSLLILDHATTSFVLAAILLNVSLTFDCADGQLARYRGHGSELGAYYDKLSDFLGLIALFTTLGWATYEHTGEAYYLVFAILALAANLTTGYAKWVHLAAQYRRRGVDPPAATASVAMSWRRYLGRVAIKLFRFAEPDLFFWIAIGLVLDRLDWTMWFLLITQVPMGLVAAIYRGVMVARLDAGDGPA